MIAFAAAALRLYLAALDRGGVGTLRNVEAGLCEDNRTVMIFATAAAAGEWITSSFELPEAVDPAAFDASIYMDALVPSADEPAARVACADGGVAAPPSADFSGG